MLDNIEQTRRLGAMMAYDPPGGEKCATAARAMVPMLDWPIDLFIAFTVEVEDESE